VVKDDDDDGERSEQIETGLALAVLKARIYFEPEGRSIVGRGIRNGSKISDQIRTLKAFESNAVRGGWTLVIAVGTRGCGVRGEICAISAFERGRRSAPSLPKICYEKHGQKSYVPFGFEVSPSFMATSLDGGEVQTHSVADRL
jgi:hypothetical protein